MPDFQHFEKDEEALFADDDPTADSEQKGLRLVPSFLMSDFIVWLNDSHPEIQGSHQLTRQMVASLIRAFERERGASSGYSAEEWLRNLQRS